jgi:hypothetical protein
MSGTDQVGMEAVMAVLTLEEQSLLGAIGRRGMPTARAGLTAIVGIDLDRHTLLQVRLVGNHTVQLGKAPLGVDGIGLPLLLARLLALFARGPLPNMGQVFQADETVGMALHKAF